MGVRWANCSAVAEENAELCRFEDLWFQRQCLERKFTGNSNFLDYRRVTESTEAQSSSNCESFFFLICFFCSFLQSQVITSSTGWVGRVWIIWWQNDQLMFNAMLIQANMSVCWFVCPAFVVFSWWTCLSAGRQQLLLHHEWWEAI